MKNLISSTLMLAAVAIITFSCNSSSNTTKEAGDTTSMSAETPSAATTDAGFSIEPVVGDYLSLKNALVTDDDKAAAAAGKQLLASLNAIDTKAIPAEKQKEYMDIAENAKENAEHIGDNIGNIGHQREHFASVSKDVKDLIAMFGTTQKLYEDHCPKYNGGKGAVWISEVKEIKNPYFGSKDPACGSLQHEY